jgi:hypothetical protein
MPKSETFAEKYPSIDYFVEEIGCIEIGDHEMIPSFVRAYNQGDTVYEGKSSYPNLDEALQDLEQGIKAYLEENYPLEYQKFSKYQDIITNIDEIQEYQ